MEVRDEVVEVDFGGEVEGGCDVFGELFGVEGVVGVEGKNWDRIIVYFG